MARQSKNRLNSSFAALKAHRARQAQMDMRRAFVKEKDRFSAFSLEAEGLLLDWSKCCITARTMPLLFRLARGGMVESKRDDMFSGRIVNTTEQRPALHIALRNLSSDPIFVAGKDVMPEVKSGLAHMGDFAEGIRKATIKSSAGLIFSDVINIGIGGSDLGPAMATRALSPYHDGPRLHFVSNVDSAHIADTIRSLDPASTLVLVASKTFTTVETMTNAATARRWIAGKLGESAVTSHFAAISTALDKVKDFGIAPDRTFGFWDWVGGRYSLWSAIGLPIMIAIGAANFRSFLQGAHTIDRHFHDAPLEKNLPLVLGLLGVWHRDVCGYPTRAVIPYDQRLERLPAYLQQLDMESNGKRVTRDGAPVRFKTGPVVWGEPGTNGQHAFFQLLHQGTDVIPVEFMIAARSHEPELAPHHDLLVANCLAQSEALMKGRTLAEASTQLKAQGKGPKEVRALAPHRVFPGNRPSLTLAYEILDPMTLGKIIALYEHRVFVEAAIWNINPFDQWGVELGKELATALLPAVERERPAAVDNSSTMGLLTFIGKHRAENK